MRFSRFDTGRLPGGGRLGRSDFNFFGQCPEFRLVGFEPKSRVDLSSRGFAIAFRKECFGEEKVGLRVGGIDLGSAPKSAFSVPIVASIEGDNAKIVKGPFMFRIDR